MADNKEEGKVEPQKVLAYTPPEQTITFTTKDAILYALGLGFCRNPLDDKELAYVYENHSDFKILPSLAQDLQNITP